MQILSEKEIVHRITQQKKFTAVIDTGAFSIKVDRYVPAVTTAIHTGHAVREQIVDKLLLNDSERKYEEDPYTGEACVFLLRLKRRIWTKAAESLIRLSLNDLSKPWDRYSVITRPASAANLSVKK